MNCGTRTLSSRAESKSHRYSMETGTACYSRGSFLTNVSSKHSTSTAMASSPSIAPFLSSRSLKSSSLFGESLRVTSSKSPPRMSRIKGPSAVTRCEIGDSLEVFLTNATPDKSLIRLLVCMGEALRTISFKVRTASCGGTACVNSFGDEQLAVDMLADKLLFEALTYSHVCKYACSEEVPELQDMGGPVEGGFSVAFDPLDGSSIVDTNFTVGTIFGVWPGDKLTGVTGRDQVAAAMGIYGPRTAYIIALKDAPGTHEFLLLDDGKWQHVKDTYEIGEGKMFSPGNLRATFDNPAYDKLINYYVREKYTLRYTGGMVPDVNQIIVKEKGIFTNVTSPTSKAKLRLLFEVAPLGFLIEKAGGFSSDGTQSVLEKQAYGAFFMAAFAPMAGDCDHNSEKWRGSVCGIVGAPIDEVWDSVSQSSKLSEWMPMVEKCTTLEGEEGIPGYVRLLSGFMFPQDDGERSWIKEKLLFMDRPTFSYVYRMEASNVGLDGSVNSLKLFDYGNDTTLIDWSFEVNPLEGVCKGDIIDYLGFLYKSCINRIEGAIDKNASSKQVEGGASMNT
ncbi:hypothetical protein MRB53_019140 [Persea americana]|uniref:Uncharacterized protein n=1 Tax=Persea americana TaxID=3435 RepID=A0ACC2M9H6_PERAE|nr:hypothetical protein MRB53_019140 [Persea americana]